MSELVMQLRRFADLEIQTAPCRVAHMHRIAPLEVMGWEVIPAVAEC